jgi:DNA-binding transcriptional ArsR family regulator
MIRRLLVSRSASMLGGALLTRLSLTHRPRRSALPTLDQKAKSIDELTAHVLNHRIRVDALAILNERPASAIEIAQMIGEPLGKVSNHLKELLKAGCIELLKTERRRGATETTYRASLRPHIGDDAWARLSRAARSEISALVFQAIVAEGLGAMRAGTFDARRDRHLSWRVVQVDEAGWGEIRDHKAQSLTAIEDIECRSVERSLESGEETFSVIVAAMAFERGQRWRSPRRRLTG